MERDIEVDRDQGPGRSLPREAERRVHEPVREGRHVFSLSADEREAMYDIGRFRNVTSRDLADLKYKGNQSQLRSDLRSLLAQGLVQRKTAWTGRERESDTYWTLSKVGKRVLRDHEAVAKGQVIYSGFVKPAELRHDAAIYRMFHRELERIERECGRVRRVVLDYELKKKVYSPLAKAKALSPEEYAKRQAEIAKENNLKVVNGHITLPDLRIEYETRQGVAVHVDLEMASESYHGSHAAEKAAAGFTMYAEADTAAHLSRALEEREITAEIFAL